MPRNIMLVPVQASVGLTAMSLGVVHAIERHGLKVQFFKPISQHKTELTVSDHSSALIQQTSPSLPIQSFSQEEMQRYLSEDKVDVLLEDILARANTVESDTEVLVIEGLVSTRNQPYADKINQEIATTLDADIIFVTHPANNSEEELNQLLESTYHAWGGKTNKSLLGCLINKIGAPVDADGKTRPDLSDIFDHQADEQKTPSLLSSLAKSSPMPILGQVPFNLSLLFPRASDLAKHMGAKILNEGHMASRRLHKVTFCARSLPNLVEHIRAGSLLVTSGDRADVIVSANLAAMNGVHIGALLLTSGYQPEEKILKLCEQGFATGLPVFLVDSNTWQTSLNIHSFDHKVPADDKERIHAIRDHVASCLDESFIHQMAHGAKRRSHLSPPAFRYQLTELARKAKKRIVLPEGDEPRTIQAAAICAQRNIADCVLLGDPNEIHRIAKQHGVHLGDGITILNPSDIQDNYVAPMVELRKHKGLTEVVAKEQLEDTVVLGTMMLVQAEVDGLVSGAVHTTANTIRPPLQLIKTAPGSSLVSSVFFMLMPDQVYIYGDCAINPDPTAEQLADIAIQSAESALAFGIEPKVAMISYSTGTSGTGSDVEKVREATELAKAKRPDIVIDGPLQYDAAMMPNVAASKAPNSPVAGQANVFIFPDLNTGNTTYKAVQRSADLISIGPMLQGMRKPVNDLSRGALVDDIVYTIALTAIQAM